jgi:hypothetical protein
MRRLAKLVKFQYIYIYIYIYFYFLFFLGLGSTLNQQACASPCDSLEYCKIFSLAEIVKMILRTFSIVWLALKIINHRIF